MSTTMASSSSVTYYPPSKEIPLFHPSLIPRSVTRELPAGYTMRPIRAADYDRGVLDVLRVLTTVGDIQREEFEAQFNYWFKHNDTYFTLVIVNEFDRVVGVGSAVVERKLIHKCGNVTHIEDIAVARSEQGKKLGLHIIHALTDIGKSQGAYKVILDCSEDNVRFYEKCGFVRVGVEMSLKFGEIPKPSL
ncbi:glucosamine 6-phosphate N-acetyltransferase [Sugiyamaella lignohabitans]|uniref:Glucosamine 6-phosphate N-acetyltransferase n=1 Tax=Sugiyamaella lignohabitans TaxID=796027 RepID=A0A167E3L7_9ASCO|nr:glucosamine 6-phosphate N-acetyltransferase [Sugiyamaella lignohabitans]ANB13595.1 glucosamine 6-phosphate N-acetyltransferase [Sugiyamaella lignohabitans]